MRRSRIVIASAGLAVVAAIGGVTAAAATVRTARAAVAVLRRITEDPSQTARAWAGRLGSLHLPPSGWAIR